jgi:GntR family transcriptional regulator
LARLSGTKFTTIPIWILRNPDLSITAKAVYCDLQSYVNLSEDDAVCWPSIRRIARDLATTPPVIVRAIAELVKAGIIEKQTRKADNGSHTSNCYFVRSVPVAEHGGVPVGEQGCSTTGMGGVPLGEHGCSAGGTKVDQVLTRSSELDPIELDSPDADASSGLAIVAHFELLPPAVESKRKPSEQKTMIELYETLFEQKFGTRAVVTKADAINISRVIKSHGVEQVEANLRQMFESDDDFIRTGGYTLAWFTSSWVFNKLSIERSNPDHSQPVPNSTKRIKSLMTSTRSLTHSPIMGTANKQKKLGGGGKW